MKAWERGEETDQRRECAGRRLGVLGWEEVEDGAGIRKEMRGA